MNVWSAEDTKYVVEEGARSFETIGVFKEETEGTLTLSAGILGFIFR